MKKRILVVVGTRPNFIKIARFREVAAQYAHLELKIVHTGQHFDSRMAEVFFDQLGISPDFSLEAPVSTPNTQMAEIMIRLERLFSQFHPDMVVVIGDVNSTLAAAIAANKCSIPLAHVESGLRSFDRSMPEEFNRVLTDQLSDLFFVTEPSGYDNLIREGKKQQNIVFTGNTMIDTLVKFSEQIESSRVLEDLRIKSGEYVLLTMHRPATVDSYEGLVRLYDLLGVVVRYYDVVFPVHPRTFRNLEKHGMLEKMKKTGKIILSDPLDYYSFQKLVKYCKFTITDSGGIQEESTFLRIPCLTLRPNTERPITITHGTNELLPFDLDVIQRKIAQIIEGNFKKGAIPERWDGKATERIMEALAKAL